MTTKTATVRDLRTMFPKLLAEIKAGNAFSITMHGRQVALLTPPQKSSAPNMAKRFGGKAPAPRRGLNLATMLSEDRGE